jgi:YVTN family beta-propeller protein
MRCRVQRFAAAGSVAGLVSVVLPAMGQEVVFATHNSAQFISVIDVALQTVQTVPVGGNSNGIAASPDGSKVYIVVSNVGVKVMDSITKEITATIPISGLVFGIGVTPDGSRAVVTRGNPANIFIIDLNSHTILHTLTPISNAVYVELAPDGSTAYVSTSRIAPVIETWISVVDIAAGSISQVLDIGRYPAEMRFHPAGSRLYVSNEFDATVSVLDRLTHGVVNVLPVGGGPRGITFSGSGDLAYVMNSNAGTVSIIDTAIPAVTGSIVLGGFPMAMEILNDGQTAYVSRWSGSNIAVVDLASNTVTGQIPLAARPYLVMKLSLPKACYANCDGSTIQPVLNVADFSCFLSKFAAGDPYANCDGSTIEPVLNVADFSCFLGKFATGCD